MRKDTNRPPRVSSLADTQDNSLAPMFVIECDLMVVESVVINVEVADWHRVARRWVTGTKYLEANRGRCRPGRRNIPERKPETD